MKKLVHPVSAAMISALILTNAISGINYVKDHNEYESKLHNQSKLIKHYKQVDMKNRQLINQKNKEINSNLNKISKYKININKLNKELDKVKKENTKLKRLAQRKEVSGRKLNIEASAYISSCSGCSGLTYTEYNVTNTVKYNGFHIIAADPSVIPLYSIVRIDTKNNSFNAIMIDTGGTIKGFKIDLLVNSYEEAIQFGRQNVTVTILREGK